MERPAVSLRLAHLLGATPAVARTVLSLPTGVHTCFRVGLAAGLASFGCIRGWAFLGRGHAEQVGQGPDGPPAIPQRRTGPALGRPGPWQGS